LACGGPPTIEHAVRARSDPALFFVFALCRAGLYAPPAFAFFFSTLARHPEGGAFRRTEGPVVAALVLGFLPTPGHSKGGHRRSFALAAPAPHAQDDG